MDDEQESEEKTRLYDVIVFGASGFTGTEVCISLSKGNLPGIRWAIAGRNKERLKKVNDQCLKQGGSSPHGIIIADISNTRDLCRMAKQAKIVLNCTGPYRFYGEPVVAACISSKTHCLDLCGEPEFYDRILLKYQEDALRAGVTIVHAAAWDSVPADLGVLLAARQAHKQGNDAVYAEVTHQFSGLVQGHVTTFEAAVHGVGSSLNGKLQKLRKDVEAKYPSFKQPKNSKAPTRGAISYHEKLEGYAVKFPGSDSSVVRYSQRIICQKDPHLCPKVGVYMIVPTFSSLLLIIFFGSIFMVLSKFTFGRQILLKYPTLFTCGFFTHEGPSQEQMKKGSFITTINAYSSSTSSSSSTSTSKVVIKGPEPGYVATPLLFLAMTNIVLLQDQEGIHKGCVTPAALVADSDSSTDLLVDHINQLPQFSIVIS